MYRQKLQQIKQQATSVPTQPATTPTTPLTKENNKLKDRRVVLHRCAQVYKQYQDNIKQVAQLKTDIIKGIAGGKPLASLLLTAVSIIGKLTNDDIYSTNVKNNLYNIYGDVLGDTTVQQQAKNDIKKRLELLVQAYDNEQDGDSKKRIYNAIKTHRQLLTQ